MMFFLRKTPHRPEVNEEREGARRLARRRSLLVLPGLVAGRETRCTGMSSPSQARGIQMWRARFPFPRAKILPARPSTEHIDDGERCGEKLRRYPTTRRLGRPREWRRRRASPLAAAMARGQHATHLVTAMALLLPISVGQSGISIPEW